MSHDQQDEILSPGQTYFDLDGDKELLPSRSVESSHAALTWRGDPNETGADATIVVVTNKLHTRTYHVHKSVLCFGSRQSKYFNKAMVQKSIDIRKKKNRNKLPSAKVELDERDADNFPIVLDFIYGGHYSYGSSNGTVVTAVSTFTSPSLMTVGTDDDLGSLGTSVDFISTDNAVSLRFLAKKFEVDTLLLAVNKFIQTDLSFKTGTTYLCLAAEYKDKRLLESAQRLCAENIDQISSKALLKLPLELFRTVIKSLESYDDDNPDLSYYLSEVVCRYLEKHPKALSAELLLELTDALVMPCIAPEAAIGYTALLKELSSEDVKVHWMQLLSLSRRCAKSVVQEYGWNDFSVNAAVNEYLGKAELTSKEGFQTNSLLFATSFAAALQQAQDDYQMLMSEQEKLEKIVAGLHESVNYLEKVNARKDEHLARQNRAIEEARTQVTRLKEQMGIVQRDQAKQLGGYMDTPTHQNSLKHNSPQQPKVQDSPQQQPSVCQRFAPQQQQSALQHQSMSDEITLATMASPILELVSPSQVGADIHSKRHKKIREMVTKHEMRSKSIIN